jgi:patatin-like phospholipase/acyl hydrolase
LIVSLSSQQTDNPVDIDKHWDILSLDGGGIRGLFTATVVEFMENYAYEYATEQLCYPKNEVKKLSMYKLFDMFAGTSTGSLLVSALVLPSSESTPENKTNMYWATDAVNIYS